MDRRSKKTSRNWLSERVKRPLDSRRCRMSASRRKGAAWEDSRARERERVWERERTEKAREVRRREK